MIAFTAQLQGLQRFVLTGDAAGAASVSGTRRVSRKTRLKIYRDAYYLRLTEALINTYPTLHGLLGERQFADLATEYIDAQPSRHFSVRWYGHRLSHWLARHSPYQEQAVLAELAGWEWAMAQAFDAADRAPVTREDLLKIPSRAWPELRWVFHPSLLTLRTRWNSAAIWSAHSLEEGLPVPVRLAAPAHWAIWRQGLETFTYEVSVEERGALRSARRGADFAQTCTKAPQGIDATAQAVWAASLVAQWVDRGWISGMRFGEVAVA